MGYTSDQYVRWLTMDTVLTATGILHLAIPDEESVYETCYNHSSWCIKPYFINYCPLKFRESDSGWTP